MQTLHKNYSNGILENQLRKGVLSCFLTGKKYNMKFVEVKKIRRKNAFYIDISE